ncbi:calcium-activated potassium channel subunit beta-1 [Eublepharis macularius]|uniref:Calcium-activated potassium channel subunit beta-1 n=1 Tax=Eublepharis macularius TaxID=481883 RepID=A0AA97J9M7_EUBMA|nr:calcium-activated potassium channel subunit beta-1 [Eublepharis macularius]
MLGKKLVAGQKHGETRALFLGLGMVACSALMYYFIGVTIVPKYNRSIWTKESICKLMKASIKEKVYCLFNEDSGEENIFRYPCLEVQVNLTVIRQVVMLYYTEDTWTRNPKCSYIPSNLEDYTQVQKQVENITNWFRENKRFPCFYDPSREESSVILTRLYPPDGLVLTFLWPTLMMTGGIFIIILVKISQYLSVFTAPENVRGI